MFRSSKRLSNPAQRTAIVLAITALTGSSLAVAGTIVPPPVNPMAAHHLETAQLPAQVAPGNILTPGAVPPPPPPAAPAASTDSAKASAVSGSLPPLNASLTTTEAPAKAPVRQTPKPKVIEHPWHPPFQRLPLATHAPVAPKKASVLPSDTIRLSNTQLNILRFSQPIKHLWFPANTPLVGKPAYFAQNHAVMLQFEPGVDQTVQIMVELTNGEVLNREAVLRKGPGAVVHLSGGMGILFHGETATNTEPQAPDTTGMAAVRLLQSVVQGMVPEGFTARPLPVATPFAQFTAQPVAFWQNASEGLRIFVFELQGKANPAITVTPPEFYRPGVEAVLLTSDTVGRNASPFLYIVEAYHGE